MTMEGGPERTGLRAAERDDIMRTARVVVTGGAGFIGSHLVERLVGDGHEVTVLDDFSTGRLEHLERCLHRIAVIEGSITDAGACARVMRGAGHVFHLAARASVEGSLRDPLQSHAVNATGTLQVLLAAHAAGVRRVVYAASSAAYGSAARLPNDEDAAPSPCSPYAVAKLAGEHYMAAFHQTHGMETVSLRFFNVFGPRQDPESPYAAVVPRFVAAALANQAPTIFGDGRQTRDFVFVQNVVDAMIAASGAPREACGRVFNIGGGARVAIDDLWRDVRALAGCDCDAVHAPARAGEVRDSWAALDHAREAFGYAPRVTLREGLRRTVHAAAQQGAAALAAGA
jgi:UDP-glucose 4-epimerase